MEPRIFKSCSRHPCPQVPYSGTWPYLRHVAEYLIGHSLLGRHLNVLTQRHCLESPRSVWHYRPSLFSSQRLWSWDRRHARWRGRVWQIAAEHVGNSTLRETTRWLRDHAPFRTSQVRYLTFMYRGKQGLRYTFYFYCYWSFIIFQLGMDGNVCLCFAIWRLSYPTRPNTPPSVFIKTRRRTARRLAVRHKQEMAGFEAIR